MREVRVVLVQRVVAGCAALALTLAALLAPGLGSDRLVLTLTLPFFGLALAVTTTAARPVLRPVGWLAGALSVVGLVGLFGHTPWAPWPLLAGALCAAAVLLTLLATGRGTPSR